MPFVRPSFTNSRRALTRGERLSKTQALDFGSVAAESSANLTVTVVGAAVGDAVLVMTTAAPAAGLTFDGWVSAADTVTVRAVNFSAASVDPASASYAVHVWKA